MLIIGILLVFLWSTPLNEDNPLDAISRDADYLKYIAKIQSLCAMFVSTFTVLHIMYSIYATTLVKTSVYNASVIVVIFVDIFFMVSVLIAQSMKETMKSRGDVMYQEISDSMERTKMDLFAESKVLDSKWNKPLSESDYDSQKKISMQNMISNEKYKGLQHKIRVSLRLFAKSSDYPLFGTELFIILLAINMAASVFLVIMQLFTPMVRL